MLTFGAIPRLIGAHFGKRIDGRHFLTGTTRAPLETTTGQCRSCTPSKQERIRKEALQATRTAAKGSFS